MPESCDYRDYDPDDDDEEFYCDWCGIKIDDDHGLCEECQCQYSQPGSEG